jgi:hypothetical protein
VTAVLQGGGVSPRNSAGLVKRVFDGIISAFHSHDGGQLGEVSERLGRDLGECPHRITHQLTETRMGLLGARNLIWPFRTGVQWSPEDHKCVAGELFLNPGSFSDSWKLSGELYELEAL